MSLIPTVRFTRAEHHAFFFEDSHLLLITFARDDRRLLFIIADEEQEGALSLDFPGDLFESRVRDEVDRIFFVDMEELATERGLRHLALGALFPCGTEQYGAYYERDSDESTLYFLHVVGDGEERGLEAVEDRAVHAQVAKAFKERYAGLLAID
ncbi:MAG: hypothetical protein OWT27_04390 [Firmicutes bacterium]|nr:hypothetical protein [Bacillota bacterium]